MYLQVSSIAYVSPQNLESTWSGRMWGLHAKRFNLKPSASFSYWLPFGAVCMETRSKRRLLWASNVCVERISFKLQALSLVPRILVSNRTWERIYILTWSRRRQNWKACIQRHGMIRWKCLPNGYTVNQRPQRLQILQAHVDIVVWEQQPAYGSRLTTCLATIQESEQTMQTCIILIFEKAVTCSHLLMQPLAATCSHMQLQVAASGCKWLQVAASGCKWLQMAASGCKWLQVAAWASGCKWLQVAASGCKWLLRQVATSGCLWLQVAATDCSHLQRLVATCRHVPSWKKRWFCRFTFFFKIVCSRLLAAMHQQLPASIETLA